MRPVPVRAYFIELDGLLSFSRQQRSLCHAVAGLFSSVVIIKVKLAVEVLLSESADELGGKRVVVLVPRRQHKLLRGCTQNALPLQGHEHTVHDVR